MIENNNLETLNKKYKSQNNSRFEFDVLKLVSGTSIALILGVISSPILTRLYSPEVFGIFAVFISLTSIITVISCLRYEFSIMLPESDEEAVNLFIGSIFISIIVSVMTIPFITIGEPFIIRIFHAPGLGHYLWLIPPTVLLGGVSVGHPALNFWITRKKRFGWLSTARILGAIFTISFQIIAAYLGHATEGSLILASVIGGGLVSTLTLGVHIWRFEKRFLINSFNWKKMILSLKRHYKFPLFDSWAGLLNVTSSQLPIFFLTFYFSPVVAGFYALGNRVLRLPMNLVGSSIAQVFYQRAAKAKDYGYLTQVVENTFYYLVVFGMFPILILTFIGKDLFTILFGSRWSEAGVFTQILSVWIFFVFISSPMSTLFRLLEKQEFSLKINLAIFFTRILSLVVGGLIGNPRISLFIFSGSGIIVYGYLSLSIMKNAGVSLNKIIRILVKNILLFLPTGVFLLIMIIIKLNSLLLVGSSALILLIYYCFLIKKDVKIKNFVKILFSIITFQKQKT